MVYHPITNIPFAYIRANFHEPNSSFLHDISITPKMSFGTGHHATTYLMVAHMSGINFTHKSVIDFGTGTGVLAIVAERLGANKIVAIDNDDWSINNAKENLEINLCTKTELIKADTISAGYKADIVLANINLNVIIANIKEIKNAAEKNAFFLFSGIMVMDEQQIIEVLQKGKLVIDNVFTKDGWISIVAHN